MNFFRHDCTAHESKFFVGLMEEFGLEGYGRFWILAEMCYAKLNRKNESFVRQCEQTGRVKFTFHQRILRQKLQGNWKKLEKFFNYCSETSDFCWEISEKLVSFDMPNILERLTAKEKQYWSQFAWSQPRREEKRRDSKTTSLKSAPAAADSPVDTTVPVQAELLPAEPPKTPAPKKGTRKPRQSTSDNAALIAHYCEQWADRYGGKSPDIDGKDARLLKMIRSRMGLEKAKEFIDAYFAMPDSFVVKAAHPVNLLQVKKMEVQRFLNSGQFITQKQARDVDSDVAANDQITRLANAK